MALEDASALPAPDPSQPLAEILIPGSLSGITLPNVSGDGPHDPEAARSNRPLGDALATDGPALRDAQAIAARIAEDEAQADEAREQFQSTGLPVLAAEPRVAPLLQPDESVHAVHASALLEMGAPGPSARHPVGGTLHLTSRRLLHVGERVTDVPLTTIEEIAIALERLLLIRLKDGLDLALEVSHPRLLRVQIAAAKAAARGKVR